MKRVSNDLCAALAVFLTCTGVASGVTNLLPVARILLFDDYADTSLWTHEGPVITGLATRRALRSGTNHFHSAGWNIFNTRTGSARGQGSGLIVPPTLPSFNINTATNFAANLQNTLDAAIISPVFQEGIGTVYFEAVNNQAGRPTRITIWLTTNMTDQTSGWPTNILLDAETQDLTYNWVQFGDDVVLDYSNSGEFYRYVRSLNYRGPAKLRWQRSGGVSGGSALPPPEAENYGGVYTDAPGDGLDSFFTVIDNIRVSQPPSDVVVRKTACPFQPGYPSVGTNMTVRCFTDNVDMNTPTDWTSRTNKVYYRWRYLDQASNDWTSVTLTNFFQGIQGNNEGYEGVIPPHPRTGDLEYYFECSYAGYSYQSPDYTGEGHVYPSEAAAAGFSPRLLGSRSQPFSIRIRPFVSPYGSISVVADEYPEPVTMELVADNTWRGMLPLSDAGTTNVSWRLKGERRYLPVEVAYSTSVVHWAETLPGTINRLPYGGVCEETETPLTKTVTADRGAYVMLTFDTETLKYMLVRAEYQNFNNWPALSDKFSESNGQTPKASFLNTFEAWPVSVEDTYSQYFHLPVPTTNVFVREPFGTPQANWMAGHAAFSVERTLADENNKPAGYVNFRNQALRLQGGGCTLGLGYVHNTVQTRTDGIRDFAFKYRLAQTADKIDVAYDRTAFISSNYSAKVTARSYTGHSPDAPSLSVIAYYQDADHFYEYRITQVPDTDNLSRDKRVTHQLYRWINGTPTLLATSGTYDTGNAGDIAGFEHAMEIRIFNQPNSTLIRCYYYPSSSAVLRIDHTDNSDSRLTYGTYGVLSEDCGAGFSNFIIQPTTTGATLTGSAITVLSDTNAFNTDKNNWSAPSGRFVLDGDRSPKGIHAVIPTQKLGVYLQSSAQDSTAEPAAPGTTAWKLFQEITVSGYGYKTNAVTVKDWKTQFLLLQVMGVAGSKADVVVDELKITSWRGEQFGSGNDDAWLATEAWAVSNNAANGHVIQLKHTRADPNADQAVRSILLENGMGMLEFDYRVLRAPAQLTVQYATERENDIWIPVHTYAISNVMSEWDHISGYVGITNPGFLRVINDRSGGCSNAWVEIDNVRAWEEPVVKDTSWRAYNVKVTQTDKQRIMLDGEEACLLNNSTTQDAEPIQDQNVPFVQSPVLPYGLGELSFKTRAYTNTFPSSLYIYATTNGWNAPTNLWFEIAAFTQITNRFYETVTVKPVDGRDYDAIKFISPLGGQRACIEDIAVTEPVFPGFDIENVQVLCRNGDSYDDDPPRHQPINSDHVGIQAELVNIRLSPSNIQMYVDYYIGTNVWGVENWPAAQVVTLPMEQMGNSTTYQTLPSQDLPMLDSDTIVQYRVRATYLGGIPLTAEQKTFENPPWYFPVDFNAVYASQGWSPYYIVYGVPLKTVWINEVNAAEHVEENGVPQYGFYDNPYIEIAVPVGVDLAGWSIDLVMNDRDMHTITLPEGLPEQTAVTNGYAFFVIGEKFPDPNRTPVPLPKLDYGEPGFYWYIPCIYAGGLRLKRPMGMYEHVIAYDDPSQGSGPEFDGELWAAEDPERQFVYVGPETHGGSLNVTNGTGVTRADWTFPLYWTPGGLNPGQSVAFPELGVSNHWIVSTLNALNGTQNGLRTQCHTFRTRNGANTNILYQADNWYRLYSVKVNQVEQLPPGEGLQNYLLPLTNVSANLNVEAHFALRQDIADLEISDDMLNWLLGFGDNNTPLASSYFFGNGRLMSLTELYWLNADPTVTNRVDGSIVRFTRDAETNYYVTASLAVNGQNCTCLLSQAVMKLEMTPSLTIPDWRIAGQYRLMPDSFDTNHQCRILLPNPYIYSFPYWDPAQAFFRWVIEEQHPNIGVLPLVNTPPEP